MLLGADDVRGDVAELYGYVNRSLTDSELDPFVDALAMRIASFDKQAIAETKRLVNAASLPSDAEIAPEWDAFIASLGRPAAQNRIKALMARGFHRSGDVENRLGFYVASWVADAIKEHNGRAHISVIGTRPESFIVEGFFDKCREDFGDTPDALPNVRFRGQSGPSPMHRECEVESSEGAIEAHLVLSHDHFLG